MPLKFNPINGQFDMVNANGGGGAAISGGTNSQSTGTVNFSNSNGVSFGLNTDGVMTATVQTNYITTAMASNRGSDFVNTTAGLNLTNISATLGSNSLSFSVGNYITTAALSNHSHGNPTLNLTNLSGTTASNSAGFTLSLSAGAGGGDAIRGIAANGSTASTNTVHFSNSNNISFGFGAAGNSTVLTADVGLAASNSAGSFTFKTLNFSNANNVTFGTSAGGIITASVAAAGGGNTYSFHKLGDYPVATHTTSFAQSTSAVLPFLLPQALSINIVRMIYSGSVAASSTQATTGNTSLSMSGRTSHNLVFYSRGVGVNSLSLQYVTSTQVVDAQLVTISFAANSTQMSYSNRLTLGTASFTKDYSSSAASQNFHTSNLTDLTGARYIDLPSELSFSGGQWWLAYGRSTRSSTQNASISVATRMLVSHNSQIAISMNTLAIGMIGGNTNSSVGFLPAHGSFSTGGAGGTTSSITMANISTLVSNNMLHIQLMRIV